MKKLSLSILILCFVLGSSVIAQDAPEFNYIGVKKCSMCHKTEKHGSQLPIWEASLHAKAYKTLQTEEADKIAADMGHETKAAETEACLKCHASGYNVAAERLEKGFKIEDGVQCETCHGAGSEYKAIKVMKDREAAVAAGLVVWNNEEELKAGCITCHNEESPTYREFIFEEMYPQIKHDIPTE